MPAWLIPALKAVLPHIGTIVSAAKPVFTRKDVDTEANQASLLQRQITELQSAASANDTHIRELAEQLRKAVDALDRQASLAARRQRWLPLLCIAAICMSVAALGIALFVLVTPNVAH